MKVKSGNDPTLKIVIDTLDRNKQALVFVNSKKRAEKTAEDIAKVLTVKSKELNNVSDELKTALARPTKQCSRLAECAKKGIVFHHSGLVSKQRNIIEEEFRKGSIKIICCTPTLALGVDLPAFRTIIKDMKRYGSHGLNWIPVMEYHQIAGRAGRPGKEKTGEAIIMTSNEDERETVVEKYIRGQPEPILSKLAVEPVLRTYLLSLIATGFVASTKEIFKFFSKTFWAYQFEDMDEIKRIILKMLQELEENEFIKEHKSQDDFVSAAELDNKKDKIEATLLGKRIAELYIDPLSAVEIVNTLRNATDKKHSEMTFLYMICKCIELRPLLRVSVRDFEWVQHNLAEHEEFILDKIEDYNEDYDFYLNSFKTALMLLDWIEEKDEEYILEKYKVRPGELNVKVTNSDWIIYSAEELARIINVKPLFSTLKKLRLRMEYGVKEELLTLLKLKGIGRVRARKLNKNGLNNLGKIKKIGVKELAKILGTKLALSVKEQLGQKTELKEDLPEEKTGQLMLSDY